ncbi:S1C family serine protease [Limosilactobacillus fastidiosus]|uniref:Trypsin-like peptidase domain-containing protein n=1 Tax=Limosilactobacillus fastidiosus TaxID=2759855 RepID=A0A7W3YBS6_9LACO|nr:trypsin-like peptidase domain-containing protein [Limosilactobacillus fastidiosus]MBB1062486.1 trypsin-like peptidase domain-containing protein [Limosilactobacillus fastidiosus]MBB1085563.1 trypsin-like peptidase domain-containing protein [Limosilactobacillus fastidiosus]MCD7083560.1 trypsin-like peptidase domain-containing protein [Limosilactobacillus fastidiosus]MCD7086016.1 trypsin-like peptidase domain-containing protein [Limosilactobacillus fastidiosus]MCD7114340.1 trypsin-like peptida
MREQNQNPRNMKNKFWLKVAGVGLLAGLVGGGLSLGIGNVIENHVQTTSTNVPAGSNKSGGTEVNKNKADLNSQATKAYNLTKDAVVSVINKQEVQSSDQGIMGLFGGQISGDSSNSDSSQNSGKLQTASEGSGVIYKKSGNSAYIVTNNHVVKGSNALQVILSNGRKVNASLVGSDAATDLAVLKINSANVKTVAEFGNSNSIAAGQDVLAIGSPMGSEYANTVTKGIISAKSRTLKSGTDGTLTSVIQTDAAINSGNSGGPLINMAGQVIGINSMKLAGSSDGSSVEGMGFAIPSNEVVKIINQLIKNGKVSRPSLGISMIDLSRVTTDQQKSVLKLPSSVDKGVVIMDVESGSTAQKAGLEQYDVITKFGNDKITNTSSLKTALYKYKIGDTAKVTYYRDGQPHTATLELSK